MRVDDGAIVALANAPSYDNNRFDEASLEDQRNRVLTDPYEPGSTFKAFTVASALEEGAVTPDRTFVVPDHIAVADRVIHDSMPHETKVMTPGRRAEGVEQRRRDPDRPGSSAARSSTTPSARFGFGEPTGRRPVG